MNTTDLNDSYILADGEYIADVIDLRTVITDGNTLILAGTGMGKSTAILGELTTSMKTLFVAPSAAQILQIADEYQDRTDMVFLSGSSTNQLMDKINLSGKNIVCTYDKYRLVLQSLGEDVLKDYVLVVDEVHKMYAAGSYRGDAINPLLNAMQDNTVFKKQVYLTATFTQELASLAKIRCDRTLTFRKECALVREFFILVYEKQDKYLWLQDVLRRLESLRSQGLNQIVLVRLFTKLQQQELETLFGESGFRSLFINSGQMNDPIVQKVITDQTLPDHYDVVITTSIMDEGINIRNIEGQIDSVHVVGATAHPEELVQYAGRLRLTAPPIYMHLQNSHEQYLEPVVGFDEDYEDHSSLVDQPEQDYLVDEVSLCAAEEDIDSPDDADCHQDLDQLYWDEEKYQSDMSQFNAENFASIGSRFEELVAYSKVFQMTTRIANKPLSWKDRGEFVKQINQTCRDILGCKFLTIGSKREIAVNYASLLSNCYRQDIGAVYKNVEYLVWRLQQLSPSVKVTIFDIPASQCDQGELDTIHQRMTRITGENHLRLKQAIPDVHAKVLKIWKDTRQEDLEGFGKQRIFKVDNSVWNAYTRSMNPQHHAQFEKYVQLTQHLNQLDDIQKVVTKEETDKIISLSFDYRNHLIVRNLLKCVQSKQEEHHRLHGDEEGLRVDKPMAMQIVKAAVTKTLNDVPDLTSLLKSLRFSGISYDRHTQTFNVDESKALNMIKKYCDVIEKNAKKRDRRFLEIKGLYYGGYSYRCEIDSRSQKNPSTPRVIALAAT